MTFLIAAPGAVAVRAGLYVSGAAAQCGTHQLPAHAGLYSTGAETHGAWGKVVDIFAVQEGVLKFLLREEYWRRTVELAQQAYLTDALAWEICLPL